MSGYSGAAFSEAQTASFGSNGGLSIYNTPAAPGALLVDSSIAFTNQLLVNGISGTALVVEDGAAAIFDSSATVYLGGDVTIGDANGAGTLGILTQEFSSSGNLTLAGNANAAGNDAYVLGGLNPVSYTHLKIFPRVRRGIGGDKTVLPVCGRSFAVMALESGGVILRIIAEQAPAVFQAATTVDQYVPEIMPGFVAEMAEQGTVGFAHLGPLLFALYIVSFT